MCKPTASFYFNWNCLNFFLISIFFIYWKKWNLKILKKCTKYQVYYKRSVSLWVWWLLVIINFISALLLAILALYSFSIPILFGNILILLILLSCKKTRQKLSISIRSPKLLLISMVCHWRQDTIALVDSVSFARKLK